MKKFLLLLFAVIFLVAAFSGCGDNGGGTGGKGDGEKDPPPKEETVDMFNNTYEKSMFYKNYGMPVMGDPFCYYEEEDGTFYLYGTTRKNADGSQDPKENYKYYTSTDFQNWEFGGVCFQPKASDWSQNRLWAPEMFKIEGRYYLYYTAAERDGATLHGSVAVADSPAGPFSNYIDASSDGKTPRFDFGYASIDGTVFIDDDGEMYYYYAKDQVQGKSTIWGVKLSNPYTVEGTPIQLTDVGYSKVGQSGAYTQAWEVAESGKNWNEGAFMLKHEGKYYLTYSANYFGSKYYSIGYATCDSPLGTFVKPKDAQIMGLELNSDKFYEWDYFSGTGHHMFMSVGEENFVVYHKHVRASDQSVRVAAFDRFGFRSDGSLYINGPTISPQPLPEVVSGYKNVAQSAVITATSTDSDPYALADGEIGVYSKFSENDLAFTDGGTITLTFASEKRIRSILVYNSANFNNAFDVITSIKINDKFQVYDVTADAEAKNPYKKYMVVGYASGVNLSKDFKVKKIEITFEGTVSLSEIVVLGKDA